MDTNFQPFTTDFVDAPIYDDMLKDPEYAAKNKGRTFKIVLMTAEEYIRACAAARAYMDGGPPLMGDEMRAIRREHSRELSEQMREGTQFAMPYLYYEISRGWKNDRPPYLSFGQEGRHRMVAADTIKPRGRFPVLVIHPYYKDEYEVVKPVASKVLRLPKYKQNPSSTAPRCPKCKKRYAVRQTLDATYECSNCNYEFSIDEFGQDPWNDDPYENNPKQPKYHHAAEIGDLAIMPATRSDIKYMVDHPHNALLWDEYYYHKDYLARGAQLKKIVYNGMPIAVMGYTIYRKPFKYMYVEKIERYPGTQVKGCGVATLMKLAETALKSNCKKLRLTAVVSAKSFYEHIGMTLVDEEGNFEFVDQTHMRKYIDWAKRYLAQSGVRANPWYNAVEGDFTAGE